MNQQLPATDTVKQETPVKSNWSAASIVIIIFSVLMWFISYYGAAKLSYDKFGSIGWAILAFIVAPFYYIYYAYFVSTRSVIMTAGKRILLRK